MRLRRSDGGLTSASKRGGNMSIELFMVFDVESVGLHGEGFAVGWTVVNRSGEELSCGCIDCRPETVNGSRSGREWIVEHVPELNSTHGSPRELRKDFWGEWQMWKHRGAILAADVPWPVETRFLAACVDDDYAEREWQGPYPLIDVASVRLAVGFDPLATEDRRPDELPIHDPLADARQSARLLIEALARIDLMRQSLMIGGNP